MAVSVHTVINQTDHQRFTRFPWQIYKSDPNWLPPLISQLEKRLDVARNPFFQYAEQAMFLAYLEGEVVGTIAAIDNNQFNKQLERRTGFFGFFETINDPNVAAELVAAAAHWLKNRNLAFMCGPVNGAPTDEVGLLLIGHDRRPAMWEGHNPPYYCHLIEDLGFHKYDDVFAYEITFDQLGRKLSNLPVDLWRIAERARLRTNVQIRPINFNRWDAEIAQAHTIYNTAFRSIPGHTDMSLAKFRAMANSIRPIMDPDLAVMAEIDGQAVGFAVALPDINEVLCHFDGHIPIWGWLKFHWYMNRIRTACFKLIGVLPEFRHRGLDILMITEIAKCLVEKRYERVEMSLISERNKSVNRFIQRVGGQVYRKYRLYERAL